MAVAATAFFVASAAVAQAGGLVARIDLSEQRMYVYQNGFWMHTWKVSTARRGYRTPVGQFRPQRLHRRWFSRKYNNSPMPYSVFFRGGYAIHGTNYVKRLGRPASHGCVRLHPSNAAQLFAMIKRYGKSRTQIIIQR